MRQTVSDIRRGLWQGAAMWCCRFSVMLSVVFPCFHASGAEWRRDGRIFTFPDDYTLELAAEPPLVERPMEAAFDRKGRLYVTESSGSNEPVEEQLKKKPHRVLRLSDSDGDGVFDSRTVFAEGLMFPEGCLWHEGSLYVAAPPQIWKFTDADDDGMAETREVWFDGKTLTGCANDLHGPYLGPDGWIYWCKGAFAEQRYDLPGQPGWTTRAAHVFRAWPGPHGPERIEPVFTAGMDNPVGLAWTADNDLIVAGTFLKHPGGGQRDGLIHAVRGGVWGKDHDVLEGHPRTGELMPPMTHLGPAAPAGLTRYGRDLLCAQFNLRKVSRHVLEPAGATWRTEDSDFLSCDHPDFHPTDVLQAPDGSVLVIDTGAWYKLCCPTSQVAKPQVSGAIYRLRKKGGEVSTEPPAPLFSGPEGTEDGSVRKGRLPGGNAHQLRRALEAAGRNRNSAALPEIRQALTAAGTDRFLFHAGTFALLEIADPAAIRPGLTDDDATVRAATLYALEQMPRKEGDSTPALTVVDVLPNLSTPDERLREASLFVIRRHPEWAERMMDWIRVELKSPGAGGDTVQRVLLEWEGREPVRSLIGSQLAGAASPAARALILGVMAQRKDAPLPESWHAGLRAALDRGDDGERAAVMAVAARAPAADREFLRGGLETIAGKPETGAGLRLSAMRLLDGSGLDPDGFEFVLTELKGPLRGSLAAEVLAGRKLTANQLLAVAGAFAGAGILERPLLLKCFAGQSDERAGLALMEALDRSKALQSLPVEAVTEAFAAFPASVQQALTVAREQSRDPDQAARLDELERTLPPGDVERGVIVFQSARAACATCHPVGYTGGNFGPDLSRVGAVRGKRDLLEAIVFPSASFVRSFEPVMITTAEDAVVYGIVTNEGAAGLTLATGAAAPAVHLDRSRIKSMTPGTFSLMPQGVDSILTPEELADVVAYLESRK